MDNNISLTIMKCPTCGGKLKVEKANEPIECVYCGNRIVPVLGNSAETAANSSETFNGNIRLDGVNNPLSALAYLEILFEEYSWESFIYSDDITIPELMELREELVKTSADNKNTWLFSFEITLVPYLKKIEYTQKWYNNILNEYKADNLDAYGMYETYAQAAYAIQVKRTDVIAQLQSYINYARKYGASADELSDMNAKLAELETVKMPVWYDSIEKDPEIIAYIQQRNITIAEQLAEKGIDAAGEYRKAVSAIRSREYLQALTSLYRLCGYENSKHLIEKVNRYFLLSNVMDNNGQLYYYKQDKNQSTYSLYPTSQKKVEEKAIIQKISKVITNCANILYYLDEDHKLRAYDLSNKKAIKITKTTAFSADDIRVEKESGKAYLFERSASSSYGEYIMSLYELNLLDGQTSCLIQDIKKVLSFTKNKVAYLTDVDNKKKEKVEITAVYDVSTHTNSVITRGQAEICGYIDNAVVFTMLSPNEKNRDLYIRDMSASSAPVVLEKNIYGFCDIIDDKIYYYIGSSQNLTLISITADGEQRNEISFCIRNILFKQGEWIYFIRGYGYNTVLCKSKPDGTATCIIASEIKKYITVKSGYLYYIDDNNSLIKVRMDGRKKQYIRHNIDEVLSINETNICYTAYDDPIQIPQTDGNVRNRSVRSVYYIQTDGANCRKLVYDIEDANEYDKDFIYYTAVDSDSNLQRFNKLDLTSGVAEELLEVKIEPVTKGCYIATCVYGSYDCPEVWMLRRYRDDILASTWYGRAFIHLYYAVSPTLVRYYGETGWFRSLFGSLLEGLITGLRKKEIEDTPYIDREW